MMTLHITYDLKSPGQNYKALHDAIKSLGDWYHPLESSWFVSTTLSPDAVSGSLRPKLDANDLIFVARVHRNQCAGWMPQAFWSWLDGHPDSTSSARW